MIDTQSVRESIWNYDLSALRSAVTGVEDLGETAADAAMEEYRRFMYLVATGMEHVAPSRVVDAVWHAHILRTRDYDAFCREVVGRFVHHDGAATTSRPGTRDEFAERYRAAFGDLPVSWGNRALCTPTGSDRALCTPT